MALTAADIVAEAKQHIRELEPPAAREWLGKARILDVREPTEYAAGHHLPGAVNLAGGYAAWVEQGWATEKPA